MHFIFVVESKRRKAHNALEYGGHTWHVNKRINNGMTVYYDCAEYVSILFNSI